VRRRRPSGSTDEHPARPTTLRAWARNEMQRHSPRMLLEAGIAMSNFSSRKWIGKLGVPTTVVVTTSDRAIPPMAQLRMAMAIPDADVRRIDDGHLVCSKPAFAAPIVGACCDVAARITGG